MSQLLSYTWAVQSSSSSESMEHTLEEVLKLGMNLEYEYDFGSTTEITIKVLDYYKAPVQNEKIVLLSRNNPIQYQCSICRKRVAAWIDTMKIYDEVPFWCGEYLHKFGEGELEEKAACEEECLLPIVNSPRMGVCGYEGSEKYPEQFVPDEIVTK